MLALSRRIGERVLFPSLDVAVQVLQIKGSQVRLGIDAPENVGVFREEIAPPKADVSKPAPSIQLTHEQRNQLNTAALAFHVAAKQLEEGLVTGAEKTLQAGLRILEALDSPAQPQTMSCQSQDQSVNALIVEDDPVEESLLTSFLRLSGFRVETASDGYEALEYLSSHPRPDFILIDMRMPRLSGPATISAIRSDPRLSGTRIFAVTGTSQEEAGVRVGPDGVDRWFQKPLNPAKLAEAMSALPVVN